MEPEQSSCMAGNLKTMYFTDSSSLFFFFLDNEIYVIIR
jgi:hypothetical protein